MKIDPKDKLRTVVVYQLKQQTFQHFIEVQGDVKSDKNIDVSPEMMGRIISRKAEVGQFVKKGETIAILDTESIEKQIEEVKTKLELATSLFERQQNLWNQKIGSEIQFLQAKNNKESLERSLESLDTQLKKAFVKSPINGTIDAFFANEGEMANPQMPFARIVNLVNVEVTAEVSENYVKSVKKGAIVSVDFPTLGMREDLKIQNIGRFINPLNRTFKIEMRIRNKEGYLKPNTMAVVKIKDFEQENAIVVPTQFIQQATDGSKFLFITKSENGKEVVAKVNLQTGKSYKGNTLITEGLQEGDKIIVKGYSEVVAGEEVKI